MPRSSAGRSSRKWKQIVANLRETATHCAKCHGPLYPELEWPHPWSTTGGHIKSWIEYPELRDDPLNAQAEHAHCNSAEGAAMTNRQRATGKRHEEPALYINEDY